MDTREILAAYQSQADDLLAQAVALELQAHDLRIKRDALLEAADLLRPLVNEDPEDLSDVVADFSRCVNHAERIIRIARAAPHKLLNATQVTRYLLDHGQTNGSFKNLRTEVNRAFANHSDDFERVSKGTYRYRGDAPVAVEEPVDATS